MSVTRPLESTVIHDILYIPGITFVSERVASPSLEIVRSPWIFLSWTLLLSPPIRILPEVKSLPILSENLAKSEAFSAPRCVSDAFGIFILSFSLGFTLPTTTLISDVSSSVISREIGEISTFEQFMIRPFSSTTNWALWVVEPSSCGLTAVLDKVEWPLISIWMSPNIVLCCALPAVSPINILPCSNLLSSLLENLAKFSEFKSPLLSNEASGMFIYVAESSVIILKSIPSRPISYVIEQQRNMIRFSDFKWKINFS